MGDSKHWPDEDDLKYQALQGSNSNFLSNLMKGSALPWNHIGIENILCVFYWSLTPACDCSDKVTEFLANNTVTAAIQHVNFSEDILKQTLLLLIPSKLLPAHSRSCSSCPAISTLFWKSSSIRMIESMEASIVIDRQGIEFLFV
jgi:hypothetical protein